MWINFHYLSYLLLFFLGAASLSLAGAGVRLVTDHSYCRPRVLLPVFFGGGIGDRFLTYAIAEELHATVFT